MKSMVTLGKQKIDRLAYDLVGGIAKYPLGAGTELHDPSVSVRQKDAVDRSFDDAL